LDQVSSAEHSHYLLACDRHYEVTHIREWGKLYSWPAAV